MFVFEGARALGMPSVKAVYAIEHSAVVVHEAVFDDSVHMYAGRA